MPLSFEHVPPRAAFNDQRVFETNIQKMLAGEWDGKPQPPQGKWVQAGAGTRSGGTASLAYPYRIFPLRVLKQVMAMFCSACGPSLQERFPDIPRFVLHRERRYMPHDLRVFAYLIDPSKSVGNRQAPMSGVLINGKQHVFAEIAFAPLGFVLTGDVDPINFSLLDITPFGHSAFHHRETAFLKLPVVQISTWLPGDFRSKEQVARDVASNEVTGRVDLNVF